MELSSFAAYKVNGNGALSFGPASKHIVFKNITAIDTTKGTGA